VQFYCFCFLLLLLKGLTHLQNMMRQLRLRDEPSNHDPLILTPQQANIKVSLDTHLLNLQHVLSLQHDQARVSRYQKILGLHRK